MGVLDIFHFCTDIRKIANRIQLKICVATTVKTFAITRGEALQTLESAHILDLHIKFWIDISMPAFVRVYEIFS